MSIETIKAALPIDFAGEGSSGDTLLGRSFSGALSLARGLLGSSGIEHSAIPTELLSLIELQRQMQIEMQSISMISNIEKSRHESKMSAIRNVRTN